MTPEQLLNSIEVGQFCLTHVGAVLSSDRKPRQLWYWTASSWTPRREFANGKTAKEAIEKLIEKLGM